MNRLSRITAILIQLQSKNVITAKELAHRYHVSLRTVYRDIRTLQESGVPIGSENGIGYFIVEGYKLPPTSITEEEASALVTSQKLIEAQGDESLIKNFNSLMIKLQATLKKYQKDNVEVLSSKTYVFNKEEHVRSEWLAQIQSSISNQTVVEISYYSGYKGELTGRRIEPLAICFTNHVWIVIAYCHLRSELREFRTDRIKTLTPTGDAFRIEHDFSIQEYFENCDS